MALAFFSYLGPASQHAVEVGGYWSFRWSTGFGIFGVPGLCLSLLAAQDSGLRWFRSPITQN